MSFPHGVQYAIWAAVLFGSTTPVAKYLIQEIHPVLMAAIFYLGSGFGLLIVRFLSGSVLNEAPISKSNYPWLFGAVFSGGILAPVLLMTGLKLTPASSASLLLNLEGVFTALLAWIVFKENFDRRIASGMILIVIGGAILTCQNELRVEISWGSILILLACLFWGIDNNFTQKVSSNDPYQVASIKGISAGIFNLALSFILGVPFCSPGKALFGIIIGFLGYGLSLALFVMALRHIGTARTGAYFSIAPFWGTILSIVILNEKISSSLILSGAFMFAGIWLHLTESHDHVHEHSDLQHDHKHVHDEHHAHEHNEHEMQPSEHSHMHFHGKLIHSHGHYPDIHHRHEH
ncbi:MAG: DMT family transporter [Candidatus Riflebacteria bacterium]|nr:DMT family transporter [Candidatus Riflebacteria bacterium]